MSSLSESSVLAGAAGVSTGYTIDQSIRFNYGDSPYMYRSASSTGNRKKFTNSFWYKRGAKLGDYQALPSVHTTESGGSYGMYLSTANVLHVFTYYSGSWAGLHYSNQVFRDVSAWYHFVWAVDTTEAVASERVRIFVNGERITSWSSESYPSLNQDTSFNNSGEQHNVGKDANGSYYVDGYGAEMHYIDGYAYGPEYFGEFKEDTDIWIPKEYTGSYGTNGFYIKGSDSSALGTDSSGNGNNLTVSGLAANDQRTDSPTNNHCVMNPIVPGSATFVNGNLDLSYSASSWTTARGTVAIPNNSGIYYYEAKVISHAIYLSFGWGDVNMGPNQNNNPATPKFYVYSDNNGKYYSSTDDGTIGDGFTNNDVIGLWYDSDSTTNNLKFYRNGTLQATKSFDFSDTTSIHGHVTHVAPVTQFYSSNSVEYRFDSAYWTNAPAGITSENAVTTNNIGS